MERAYILDGNSAPQEIEVLDRDSGFVWARTTDESRTTLRLCPSEVYPSAYAVGRAAGIPRGMRPWNYVYYCWIEADDWKKAQDNHAHTSYYGAGRVRDMRAFWLGRLRATRDLLNP